MGLLGSNYFGKNIDPQKISAGINIEMIGKESPFGPKSAWLTGFNRSDFGKIIQKNLNSENYLKAIRNVMHWRATKMMLNQ